MDTPQTNGNPHLSREALAALRRLHPERSGLIQAYGLYELGGYRLNPGHSGMHALESLGITSQDQVTMMFRELKELAIDAGLLSDPSAELGGQS